MIQNKEDYAKVKWLLDDNKNGNAFSKGGYLRDDNVAFLLGEVAAWEAKQAKLQAYRRDYPCRQGTTMSRW